MFDQQDEDFVADQVAVVMHGKFVSVSKMTDFEYVVERKVASAEATEMASVTEISAGQQMGLVAKAG